MKQLETAAIQQSHSRPELSALAPGLVSYEQRRTLLIALPVLTAICLFSVRMLAELPHPSRLEMSIFILVGALLLVLTALLSLRWVSYGLAAVVTVLLTGGLLLERMLLSFVNGTYDDPTRSLFMTVYAYYAIFYVMIALLLPYPRSARVGTLAWLGMATAVTVGSYPYWHANPPRQLLSATLLYVWLGQGLFVLLLFSWARRQKLLLDGCAGLTARTQADHKVMQVSEAIFRGVFDQAAVGVAILDQQGVWLRVNQRLCDMVGYSEAELLKTDFQTITHPDDLEKDIAQMQQVIAGKIDGYQMEKRYIRKDGSVVWILLFVRRMAPRAGDPGYFVSVVEDINDRKQAEEKLEALHVTLEAQVVSRTIQLQQAVASVRQHGVELALITEMTGQLAAARGLDEALSIVANSCRLLFPRAATTIYVRSDALSHHSLPEQAGGDRAPAPAFAASAYGAPRRSDEAPMESEHGERDARPPLEHTGQPLVALGETFGVLTLSWAPQADGWSPAAAMLKPLTEQVGLAIANVRLLEELQKQALHDPLTGLYNRRQLDEHLRVRMAEHARSGRGYSLLLLDLDHFKCINDRFGHEAGDHVLQETAAVLSRGARTEETVFRLGGEEFVIVLTTEDAHEAAQAAERLRADIQSMRVTRRGEIMPSVTVSIGIASYPQDADNAADLLRQADQALYAAKRGGRNQILNYNQLQPADRLAVAQG